MRAFLFANENGQGVPPCVADVTPFASSQGGRDGANVLHSVQPCAKAVETFFAYNFVIRRATPPLKSKLFKKCYNQ